MPFRATAATRLGSADLVCLALTFAIGLLHVPFPFMGDQAVYAVGADSWNHGGVLYRDFWDIKQPGIVVFMAIGERLFGYSEHGIHAWELLYMFALAVVIRRTAGTRFRSPAAALLPLTTVGLYYAAAGYWHLTQVEVLLAFPMYLCVW